MTGWTSPPERETPGYFGKYPGRVLNNAPDADSVHRGRLLVEVSGILEENPEDENSSRPIQVLAKPCFPKGFFHLPQVEEPVWVEFAAGSIDEPLWSGVWHPEEAAPENSEGEPPTEHDGIIRTASGHVLELSDEEGNGRIVLKDGVHGATITMDAEGIRIEDGNDNSVTLDSNGIRLTAGGCTIELGGTTISLDNGTHTLAVEATGTTATSLASQSQPLVLGPVLEWLLTHQHAGNMGGPTPVFPSDLAALAELLLANGKSAP